MRDDMCLANSFYSILEIIILLFYIYRACIGQRFAKLELFTLMTKIVQNYKMEYVGDGELGIKTRLVTVPDRQIKIKFSKRQ